MMSNISLSLFLIFKSPINATNLPRVSGHAIRAIVVKTSLSHKPSDVQWSENLSPYRAYAGQSIM